MKTFSHPDFPVIDAHVHLYPEAIACKVTPALAARFGNAPSFDGTVAGCAAADAAGGLAGSVNQPVATSPDHINHTNAFWQPYARGQVVHGVVIQSLAAFHPLLAQDLDRLKTIADQGFAGIKFHPEYQTFTFNDPKLDDLWSALAELGLVAYLHAGGERVFQPPYHSSPSTIRDLHRRFPKLKIVAAHLGGWRMWKECEDVLLGEDVDLDLSHTFFWMPNEQILRMIRRHGADHILFGTDAPWQNPREVLEEFLQLPLSEEERRKICFSNVCKLLNVSVDNPFTTSR